MDILCDKLNCVEVDDEDLDNVGVDIDTIYDKDEDGDTLLHVAIILLKLKYIKLFILKATIRRYLSFQNLLFQTPLHLAAITNQPEVVRQLVDAGAEVESRDREGNTALHIACREGFLEIVHCLLKPVQFFELNDKDNITSFQKVPQDFSIRNYDGVTILHLAASNRHYGIIDALVEQEIDINMKEGKAGRTVLHNSCESGDVILVRTLLQLRTCNINARAYDGSTPFDLARARGHDTVCMALAAAGARYGDDNSDSEE